MLLLVLLASGKFIMSMKICSKTGRNDIYNFTCTDYRSLTTIIEALTPSNNENKHYFTTTTIIKFIVRCLVFSHPSSGASFDILLHIVSSSTVAALLYDPGGNRKWLNSTLTSSLTSFCGSPRAICSWSSFCSSLRAPMDCWLRAKSDSSFSPASVKYLEKCSQLRLLAGKSSYGSKCFQVKL